MGIIASIGTKDAANCYSQETIKEMVSDLFHYPEKRLARLLPVFDHAMIRQRQFAEEKQWYFKDHSFSDRNNRYLHHALHDSLAAIDACLSDKDFLSRDIDYNAIDMFIFVSSTGIATPALDASIMNARPFRSDVHRMPLWGLGCAGGAIGLSRAFDWINSNPGMTCLLVSTEMCSLTFQKNDQDKSNFIGSALFGDGTAAVLLMGNNSKYLCNVKGAKPHIVANSSHTEKNTEGVMGWDVTESGLKVIFSKSIPSLVETLWKRHMEMFFHSQTMGKQDIDSFIVHPGGAKVLEAMESTLAINKDQLKFSYQILWEHGNMSSPTVIYVLKEWMKTGIKHGEKSILSALGPGFSSEVILLEWR